MKSLLFAGLSLAAAAILSIQPAAAEWGLNLPRPVTPIGADILTLHNWILVICVVIFVGVFSVMFYSLYAHRKSKGAKPAQFSHSTTLEYVWSTIPALILIGMAIPSTATLIEMEDTENADMTVKVTGYQWLWHYEYLDHDVDFYSRLATPSSQINNMEEKSPDYLLEVDEPLVLPVGTRVRFLITASDVIHAWWVPEFGVKKDAIPGFVNEVWTLVEEEGTYRGQCAELCGKDHGFMPIVVEAVSQEEFDEWVASRQDGDAGDDGEDQAGSAPGSAGDAAALQIQQTTALASQPAASGAAR
ncbi:MAG: cytochrome c oxidase subunit II [Gammaproteobacteria bacterium]|nr:cytochrome c oxidase subunit II [Gammaproteobacteria bacterium]